MANSITTFKKYIDLLDEVYKQQAKTAILDGDNSLVQMGSNTHEIVIPKISMDGLGDYSRNGGYVDGDVTLTNETVAFNPIYGSLRLFCSGSRQIISSSWLIITRFRRILFQT